MADIKTRDAVKGTINTIDKSAVAAERMKDAFIRTKEKADHSYCSAENSPEEYAADRVTGGAEAATYGAAREFDRHGQKAVQDTKENIAKAKDYLEQRKAAQPQEAAKKAAEKAQETARAAQQPSQTATYPSAAPTPARAPTTSAETPQPSPAGARIKTIDRQRTTIRTQESTRAAIKQPTKAGQVKTIKGTTRTVKTAEQSSRAAIMTSEQAARTAQASAKATVKTAERTAQAARAAAKTAAETTKRAAEATAKAIKTIIAGTKALIETIVAGTWISVMIILIVVMLGVAISLFGSGSGNSSYTPVSAEVEAYTPLIRLYANKYGVGEYMDLIKAIMMQESGGRGLDPMQASESGYNTRYPHSPNAITDPEYSIDVGVQTIADSLHQANVESPIDMDNIKLALQGYNYGNGFISWARANYGGYSTIAAIEFSDMMAARMGWSGYGDKQYPAHVLRYYPIGRAFTVGSNQPENHIAPHLLGRLVLNLKSIASKKNAQAIMTSHSPAIVKRIDPVAIRHFRLIDDGTTQVRRIILPDKEKEEEQYKFVKEAVKAYPEIYFAKLVILGEGDSEELLLPRFWEATTGDVDLSGVSIVPLGGSHVNHFWRLLNDLDIPHVTLLDLDREREGGGWGRIHYVLSQLMKLGIKREDLLSRTNGTLSEDDFQQMAQWNVADLQLLQAWIDFLENYNVFFSSPLDIDFLMLENYGDIYKDLLSEREGPRLTVATGDETTTYLVRALEKADIPAAEYISRVERDVKATLKEHGGDGSTYSEGQKKLMVWYNYFFLNRGKPSTHMSALSAMSSEILMANIPPVFERLIKSAERLQAGEVNEKH